MSVLFLLSVLPVVHRGLGSKRKTKQFFLKGESKSGEQETNTKGNRQTASLGLEQAHGREQARASGR